MNITNNNQFNTITMTKSQQFMQLPHTLITLNIINVQGIFDTIWVTTGIHLFALVFNVSWSVKWHCSSSAVYVVCVANASLQNSTNLIANHFLIFLITFLISKHSHYFESVKSPNSSDSAIFMYVSRCVVIGVKSYNFIELPQLPLVKIAVKTGNSEVIWQTS